MKKIVIYWSGTGNTEAIANIISADCGCDVKNVADISVIDALDYDVIILGCPAMGVEELEDVEFKPFYDELISNIGSQKIFLFGSYDWGDGEWMRIWQKDVLAHNGNLGCDGLIVNGDVTAIDDNMYQAFIRKINS